MRRVLLPVLTILPMLLAGEQPKAKTAKKEPPAQKQQAAEEAPAKPDRYDVVETETLADAIRYEKRKQAFGDAEARREAAAAKKMSK